MSPGSGRAADSESLGAPAVPTVFELAGRIWTPRGRHTDASIAVVNEDTGLARTASEPADLRDGIARTGFTRSRCASRASHGDRLACASRRPAHRADFVLPVGSIEEILR